MHSRIMVYFPNLPWRNDIKGKMPCKCCIADYLKAKHNKQANIDVNAFGLNVASRSSTFATILTVECYSGKHSFVIKPPRRHEKEVSETDGNRLPKKKRGHPQSTNYIRDYAINYYQACLLMQVLLNGITSLDTTMGLLGLGPHSGSHCKLSYILHMI